MNVGWLFGATSPLILYLLLTAAVISDFRSMRVSNRLILVGLAIGLGLRFLEGGMSNLIRWIPNIVLPVVLLFFFYLIGVIGSGDVKLFSVIGCFYDLHKSGQCIILSFLLAGAVSLVQLFRSRWMKKGGNQIHFTAEMLLAAVLVNFL